MRTQLLLCSELKGYIKNPGWYFESKDEEHVRALDLLIPVQGWRRYSWNRALQLAPFNSGHYLEKEILIKGRILSQENHQPKAGITVGVEMFLTDTTSVKGVYTTGKNGDFIFSAGEFEGKRLLLLTTDSLTASGEWEVIEARITLDRQFSPRARTCSADEMACLSAQHPLPFVPDSADVNRTLDQNLPLPVLHRFGRHPFSHYPTCIFFCRLPHSDSLHGTGDIIPSNKVIVNKLIPGPRIICNFFSLHKGEKPDIIRLKGTRAIRRNDVLIFNFPYSNRNKSGRI